MDNYVATHSQQLLANQKRAGELAGQVVNTSQALVTGEVVFASKPDAALLFPQPKTTDLEPHMAPVVQTSFSPFHRKMLLTCALDGCVKLFDIIQQRPLFTFYPPTVDGSVSK